MFTLAALALWMVGLGSMLAGHLAPGAIIAGAGAALTPRALSKRDDMETALGIMFVIAIVGALISLLSAGLRAIS